MCMVVFSLGAVSGPMINNPRRKVVDCNSMDTVRTLILRDQDRIGKICRSRVEVS